MAILQSITSTGKTDFRVGDKKLFDCRLRAHAQQEKISKGCRNLNMLKVAYSPIFEPVIIVAYALMGQYKIKFFINFVKHFPLFATNRKDIRIVTNISTKHKFYIS